MTNRSFLFQWLGGFAVVFILSTSPASAWLRWYAPEDELAARSDSIVVGHVEGSFEPVRLMPSNPSDAKYQLFEYRTTLVITEVLKGSVAVGKTPLLIHYGIKPVVLKSKPTIEDTFNPPAADTKTDPMAPVGIYDAATTAIGGPPSDNIRQDHLWFLRTSARGIGPVQKEDTDAPGIWSPQDVQDVDKKDYFFAILSGDPDALSKFSSSEEWKERNIRTAQNRLKVKKIATIPDLSQRCDQLLPFYLNNEPAADLALEQILACGPIGCAKLVPVFQDPKSKVDKRLILFGWGRANYTKEVAPLIVEWLQKEDHWWAGLTREDQIWAMEVGQKGGEPYNDPRAASFRNMYCAIEVLDPHTPGAKAIIKQIGKRWKPIDPLVEQNNLSNFCDQALSSFP